MPPRTPERRRPAPPRTDRALILRRFRFRESSLVCHFLTPEHGRVSVLARGAYRPKSAYSGVLDLFDTLSVGWSPGKDLGNLRTGSIERRRRGVSRGLDRYRAGLRTLELARLAAREGHEERELFALLEAALDQLDRGRTDPALVTTVFELKYLAGLGLAPAWSHCAVCGEPAAAGERTLGFAAALGGRVCARCEADLGEHTSTERFRGRRRARPMVERVPLGIAKVADSLRGLDWGDLARIRLDADRTEGVGALTSRFLAYHLETRPRVEAPRARRPAR